MHALQEFTKNRLNKKHSSDELMRQQRYSEAGLGTKFNARFAKPSPKDLDTGETAVSSLGAVASLRRGVDFYAALQV
jgi:hypothetical protein